MNVIEFEEARKEYRMGSRVVRAVDGVSLAIGRGEFVALSGPSGSGKTTLLNLAGCLDVPDAGKIRVEGRDVSVLKDAARSDLRLLRIGFVFQSFNLIPVLTAEENIELPLLLGKRVPSARERRAAVARLVEEVGLGEWRRHRPAELSGGQRQRVAIARALARTPALVLADEPTANLDSRTAEEIVRLMEDLNRREGTTFVFSTHDPRIVAAAGRVVRMEDGRAVSDEARARETA